MSWKKIGVLLTMLSMFLPGGVWAEDSETAEPVTKLDQIVVTGTRTAHALKDAPVETTLITREDIEQSNAQTVSDLLKTIPGLSIGRSNDLVGAASSSATMRGLSFNEGYGLILIDGQRVQGSTQSGGHGEYAIGLNQIPVSMIERIEIVKGPSSVLYGSDAMAGVINIITRKIPSKATSGASAKYGWYKMKDQVRDGVVSKPSDDGHHRNTRAFNAYTGNKINDRMGFLLNYSHEYSERNSSSPYDCVRDSGMGKFDVVFSDKVSAWVKGEISAFSRESDPDRTEDSYRISVGMDFDPSENHRLMFKGYHYLDDFSSSSSSGQMGYDQGELQYTWYTGAGHVLTAGTEFQRQGLDYSMTSTSSETSVTTKTTVDEDVDTFSVYLQDEWTLFKKLVLVPGVRYDDHSTFGGSFNPKLNVLYHLRENTSLRASVGKAFKSPTIRQLYYDEPWKHGSYYIMSNPDLDPEESIGYSAGIEQWLFDNKGMINVTYFRNEIDDMVLRYSTGELYQGCDLRTFKNVDEAMTQGVEVTVQFYPTDSFSLTAGYAFTDSEDKSTGNELTYTPEHAFTISPAYEYTPWGLGASGTLEYASDQYTDTDNTTIQEAHTVVDVKIFKRLSKQSKLTFEVDNVFDSDNGYERSYSVGRSFTLGIDMTF
ncbi:TonB-dependent receptor [Desulfosarcina ovata subsp. sediminis]|uniref:TonB-dependent receptor n=1 Tax=Desulfosarcina ovata subsp. sediminis TaxID=885957 RepID=A0A5K7ZQ90_9BACT|nr:TonB-dependent receptor [Desulfosarcina ovata]BBO82299.1 TonB-dependent receptor [Desulfosarcina ovata subsp. sediminis]